MLFVQLSSILLVGYFVTAHCILTPILFICYYTVRRRVCALYKLKKTDTVLLQNHVCFF